MPYMVKAKIMHDERRPVLPFKLRGQVSCHIVVNLCKVLCSTAEYDMSMCKLQ